MGTITKALEMLGFFTRTRSHIGLGEFVKLTGRDKATVHRHLVELEANGFLEQHPVSRAYRLGPAILRLNAVREAAIPVRAVLRPIVTDLAEEVGELAHASLLQGEMLSPIFQHDPMQHGTQVHFDEAEMLPLHATSSGLAVLAFSPPGFARRILSAPLRGYTTATATDTDPEALGALIETTRAQGYSRLDRAFDDEVSSQGVPIFGPEGEVMGALSVAVPAVRVTEDKMRTIRAALIAAAARATRSFGGVAPPVPADPRPTAAQSRPAR